MSDWTSEHPPIETGSVRAMGYIIHTAPVLEAKNATLRLILTRARDRLEQHRDPMAAEIDKALNE